jgi:hypothetical protein
LFLTLREEDFGNKVIKDGMKESCSSSFSVVTAMDWMAGVQFPALAGSGTFCLATMSRLALEPTKPPVQLVMGILFPGVKWLGHEADHSPLSSAEVKNVWSCTSTPQYMFMVWCLIKQ